MPWLEQDTIKKKQINENNAIRLNANNYYNKK